MRRDEMINKIKDAVKETHNEQDLIDLNEMSTSEVKDILMDIYFGEEFMLSNDKGAKKTYNQ
tara:strand:- start:669 stop:854 length:186 start_codon:yes stop_codon:yes gene_type:complete